MYATVRQGLSAVLECPGCGAGCPAPQPACAALPVIEGDES